MQLALNFFENHWGDLASVIGFGITIVTLLRTKSAAEAAKKAVLELRSRLTTMNTVAELSSVLEIIEEIKRLHRVQAWEILLDRYSAVRRRLISIQGSAQITMNQSSLIASAIQQFRTMELRVERTQRGNSPPDLARLNRVASKSEMT